MFYSEKHSDACRQPPKHSILNDTFRTTRMDDNHISLNVLRSGQRARIKSIQGHPDHVLRLEEFGLRAGIYVEMFRRGNPCILRLAGNKLCLRSDEMLQINVELVAEDIEKKGK